MPQFQDYTAATALAATDIVLALAASGTQQIVPRNLAKFTGPTYRVKDYNTSVGDGSTVADTAVASAIADARSGTYGGRVLFEPGSYVLNAPIDGTTNQLARVTLEGSGGGRYHLTDDPTSASRLVCGGSWSGTAMIKLGSQPYSFAIRNLGLHGNGVGGTVHGITTPDWASIVGEQSILLENCEIAGFSGDGFRGSLSVATLINPFFILNKGWGMRIADNSNRMLDSKIFGGYFAYNRSGGVWFGGTGITGLVSIVGTRFERSGWNPADIASPFATDSPGILIEAGRLIRILGCDTDANTGPGLRILGSAGGVSKLSNIEVMGCTFHRDRTGGQVTMATGGGVEVKGFSATTSTDGANYMKFVDCTVITGLASDDGSGTIVQPAYGVWAERTEFFQWLGGYVEGVTHPFYLGATPSQNFVIDLHDLRRGINTVPTFTPPTDGTGVSAIPDGALWFNGAALEARLAGSTVAVVPPHTQSVAYAASVTPNPAAGKRITVGTLTGNITIVTPTSPVAGQEMTLVFTQDATGGRVVTLPSAWFFSWTPTTTANHKNSITLVYDGSNWVQIAATTGLT